MIDRNQLCFIEIGHLFQHRQRVENIVPVSRYQMRDRDIFGRIGQSVAAGSHQIAKTSHASKIADKSKTGTVPSEQVGTGGGLA